MARVSLILCRIYTVLKISEFVLLLILFIIRGTCTFEYRGHNTMSGMEFAANFTYMVIMITYLSRSILQDPKLVTEAICTGSGAIIYAAGLIASMYYGSFEERVEYQIKIAFLGIFSGLLSIVFILDTFRIYIFKYPHVWDYTDFNCGRFCHKQQSVDDFFEVMADDDDDDTLRHYFYDGSVRHSSGSDSIKTFQKSLKFKESHPHFNSKKKTFTTENESDVKKSNTHRLSFQEQSEASYTNKSSSKSSKESAKELNIKASDAEKGLDKSKQAIKIDNSTKSSKSNTTNDSKKSSENKTTNDSKKLKDSNKLKRGKNPASSKKSKKDTKANEE